MGIINEAPYKIRRSYVILFALWYGNKKPPAEAFFDDTIRDLTNLVAEGFFVNEKRYKVRVLVISTDTVARPLVWNTTQFNGECGCNFCLTSGIRVPRKKGNVRVYPLSSIESIPCLRTLDQHLSDATNALKLGKRINGIKGPTPFQNLPNFDFVKACVPEYMHSCCQGVIKLMISLWFGTPYRKKPWYIGNMVAIVNARLSKIKPPYEITRSTGDIDDIPNWKASMFRAFGLYFFKFLKDY